jgi:hypothetical protein
VAGHADDIDRLTLEAVAQLKADLRTVATRIRRYLQELLAKADTDGGRLVSDDHNLELAAKLGREYSDTLLELGYDDAIEKLRSGFEAIAQANEAYLGDQLGESYTSPNLRALVRGADRVLDHLKGKGEDAATRLRELLVLGATSNVTIDREVGELSDAASITLNQALVEAQTSLMAFHRDSIATESQAAGVDLFTYDGPDDAVDRPFCALLVGKIVTLQDLDDMENGDSQPKPVSRFLGGYRCRHSLSPISLEEAQALVEEQGAGVIGRGCALARQILLKGKDGPAYSDWLDRNAGEVVGGKVVRRRRRVA